MKTIITPSLFQTKLIRLSTLILLITLFAKTGYATCVAGFTYSLGSGNTVHFTSTSTGTGITHTSWSFDGPSGFSNATNPTYIFFNPGYHYVCVKVRSSTDPGCEDEMCDSIFIPGTSPCEAIFAITNDSTAPTPAQIWFNALPSKGANLIYIWEYDDGSPADTTVYGAGGHIVPTPGLHTVCLTVMNVLDTSCHHKTCHTFKAGPKVPCNANFYNYADTISTPWIIHYNAGYNQPNTTYSWDFGDGGTDSVQSPTHSYSTTGAHVVCLTITNIADSCSATQCDTIYAEGSLSAGIEDLKRNLNIEELYPNPVNDALLVRFAALHESKGEVAILNTIGQTVYSENTSIKKGANTLQINTSDLAKGVYFITIRNGETSELKKFIK